jgi:hypothetical protein
VVALTNSIIFMAHVVAVWVQNNRMAPLDHAFGMLNADTFSHWASIHCDCHLAIEIFRLMFAVVGTFSSGQSACSNSSQASMLSWLESQTHGCCLPKNHAFSLCYTKYGAKLCSITATILGSVDVPGNTYIPALYSPVTHAISCSIMVARDALVGSSLVKPS